jgi:hypothetical protein
MKQQILYERDRQNGIALPIIMIILVLAALVTIYTTTSSVKEQQVTADQYRSEQAFSVAQAGVDVALERHNHFEDYVGTPEDTISADLSKGSFIVMFCDIWDDGDDEAKSAELMADFLADTLVCTNSIHPTYTNSTDSTGFKGDKRVGILSVGKPDDASGRRTISIVSAPAYPRGGKAPPLSPLISKSTVDVSGTLNVINRYENSTIWSAQAAEEYSASVSTFINDGLLDPCTGEDCGPGERLALVNPDEDVNTTDATNIKIGQNSDVLDDDHNLAALTDGELFNGVFADSSGRLRGLFTEYTDLADLNDDISSGKVTSEIRLIWLEDDDLNGQLQGDLGDCSIDPPEAVILVAIVADGDTLKFAGGNNICGFVFVFGDVELAGGVVVSGGMISTGAVNGVGTFTIVYDPDAMTDPPEGYAGSRGIDAGTWKDWGWIATSGS